MELDESFTRKHGSGSGLLKVNQNARDDVLSFRCVSPPSLSRPVAFCKAAWRSVEKFQEISFHAWERNAREVSAEEERDARVLEDSRACVRVCVTVSAVRRRECKTKCTCVCMRVRMRVYMLKRERGVHFS